MSISSESVMQNVFIVQDNSFVPIADCGKSNLGLKIIFAIFKIGVFSNLSAILGIRIEASFNLRVYRTVSFFKLRLHVYKIL